MASHAMQVFSGDKCGGAHLPRIAAQLLKCPTKDIAAIPAWLRAWSCIDPKLGLQQPV